VRAPKATAAKENRLAGGFLLEFEALFDSFKSLIEAVNANADTGRLLFVVSKVASQPSQRKLEMPNTGDHFFKFALNAILARLKALEML
jgi:hypothetical protein